MGFRFHIGDVKIVDVNITRFYPDKSLIIEFHSEFGSKLNRNYSIIKYYNNNKISVEYEKYRTVIIKERFLKELKYRLNGNVLYYHEVDDIVYDIIK